MGKITGDTLDHIMNFCKDFKVEGHIDWLIDIIRNMVELKLLKVDQVISHFTK